MKNFEVKHFPSDVALARAAAGDWLAMLPEGKTTVAISGGRIAKTFFAAVAELGAKLENVHFFWADERCVPPDSADSNFRLANETLFKPLSIAPGNIHRLRGEIDPIAAVREANAEIGGIVLDMVFLGLGEDGHVASLFPNASSSVLNCKDAYLTVKEAPKPPPNRISLSYAAIAAAKNVWMLASGAGKKEALRDSLEKDNATPFGRVLGMRSGTRIYTDFVI